MTCPFASSCFFSEDRLFSHGLQIWGTNYKTLRFYHSHPAAILWTWLLFRLGITQLGVWFLCRWYSVLFPALCGTLLSLKICRRRLCDFILGLVWISFLFWPPLAFEIIWFNWCHPPNFVLQRTRIQCRQNSPWHLFLSYYDPVLVLMVLYCVFCMLFGVPL